MLYLTRTYDFCASHRLYNPDFSDEKNWDIYRECSRANGHGHNYGLEVRVKGTPDPRLGMVVDIYELDNIVKARIIDKVDHYHLNYDVDFLTGINPTAENVVMAFWDQLHGQLPAGCELDKLILHETKKNIAEYTGN